MDEEFDLNEALSDGQYVEFKPDSPYNNHSGEVYMLSQCDGKKCWIGDKQGRGWYTFINDLKRVPRNDPRVNEYFGKLKEAKQGAGTLKGLLKAPAKKGDPVNKGDGWNDDEDPNPPKKKKKQ